VSIKMPITRIFHVCAPAAAAAALAQGEYRAPSLGTEGFIHLAQAHQVRGVVDRYYEGQTGLVVLVVAPELLRVPLRFEAPASMSRLAAAPAADASQLFPHLYGPLNSDAIVEVRDLAAFLAASSP
jgi:uncharacterized protein (DUF952 family)